MNTVVIDLFLGDSGKGKISDYLAASHDVVVRFNGANNAGHTLYLNGTQYKTHAVPSGVLYKHATNFIAHGCAIDPFVLASEIDRFKDHNDKIYISGQAHVILPYHIQQDIRREAEFSIGSTKRGVAPAYADKAARQGIRYEMFLKSREEILQMTHANGGTIPAYAVLDFLNNIYDKLADKLRPHIVSDGVGWLHSMSHRKLLFEGAQGCFLDVDVGPYPYVTSSNCTIGAVLTGTGLNMKDVGEVVGVVKAYGSYVGTNKDFPDIEDLSLNDRLCELGQEYGATTGRRRRLCWLDLEKIKRAVRINGPTKLVITRMDTLGQMPKVFARSSYDGELVEFEPWGDLSHIKDIKDLPHSALKYLDLIEQELGVPVWAVGTGPNREDLLFNERKF